MKIVQKIKKNEKGFTMIEIIVVLLILAILAAVTIPSMLGFINEANGKAKIPEARTAYMAAQMIMTESRGDGPGIIKVTGDANSAAAKMSARMLKIVSLDVDNDATVDYTVSNGRILTFTLISEGVTVIIDAVNGTTSVSQ